MSVTVQRIPREPRRDTVSEITTDKDEDVIEMSPRRKESRNSSRKLTTSFLLTPFLKAVDTAIESGTENPVLRALFGNKNPQNCSPWTYVTRTSINNCHPFKKTEFSCDLSTDGSPAQLPKSLAKKQSRFKKTRASTAEEKSKMPNDYRPDFNPVSPLFRDKRPNGNGQCDSGTLALPSFRYNRQIILQSASLDKKKKILSQPTLSVAKTRIQYVNSDRLLQLRAMVNDAIKNHKVFSMTGCYTSVRNALKQRGWIEKIDSDIKNRRRINKFEEIPIYEAAFQFVEKNHSIVAMRLAVQTNSGFVQNDQIHYTGQGEAEIMNRMLRNVTEDLCWLSRPYPYYCWKEFEKFEMINRLPRAYFSNKVGLCNSLKQLPWFYETGVCSTQFPRTYNTSMKDEVEAFKEDFRLTASIGMLKWFMHAYKNGGEKAVWSPDGKVESQVIEFSLRRCAEFIKSKQHEDIDVANWPTIWEYQWDQFIAQYYKVVNDGQILKESKEGLKIEAIASNVQSMLNILKPYWPQQDIDGYQNYWIIKPGGRCCGAGIVIKNNLEQILLLVNPNPMKESRYVVQKYIERPLLIYNTKFDIRQWFLVTNVYPLTVWMYKECYLRFCSQPFTLKNTHESIHLCNNAVQRKYKNGRRDRGLPDENMWDCYTFQTYLKAIGHPDVWDKHIYPGMKEGFVGALLASQDNMERRKNCFELYGADFMISETLTDGPWLIEINSNPAMESSTSVTARMCPQVLEDIIKVVIDRRDNKSASTGAFEMVFKQSCPPIPPYFGMSLSIKGRKAYRLTGDYRVIRKSKGKTSSELIVYSDTEEESTGEEIFSAGTLRKDSPTTKRGEYTSDIHASRTPHKEAPGGPKTGEAVKRRKVDWVRKNIQDLKASNSVKQMRNTFNRSSPKGQMTPPDLETETSNPFFDETKQISEISDKKNPKEEETEIKKEFKDVPSALGTQTHSVVTEETNTKCAKLLRRSPNSAEQKSVSCNNILEKESPQICSGTVAKTCPNFDIAFEKELQNIEEMEGKKPEKPKQVESCDSFFSASSQPCSRNSKTSLDYFWDWKSKINDTRRTCEDLLAMLQVFQEQNSKVKFQDALQKRMTDEVEFVNRIRRFKKSKKLGRVKDGGKPKPRDVKLEECRQAFRAWDCDGDEGLTPLAINSETGAVRNINDSLPKFKQRSRPLLPNGSSGHGRRIDVALEQTAFYY